MNIKNTVNEFIQTLNDEYSYLLTTKEFLMDIEEKITEREMNGIEFNNLLIEYELKAEFFMGIKEDMMTKIAQALSIEKNRVSFNLLINMGFSQFRTLASNLNKIGTEIRLLLLKLSVFLKNYSSFNEREKKFNLYVSQKNYSFKMVNDDSTNRERHFCWEG